MCENHVKYNRKSAFQLSSRPPHPERPHNYRRTGGVSIIMPPAIIPWIRVCTLNPFILRGGCLGAGGVSQRGGPKDSIKKQGKPMQINTNSATSIEFYTISSKIIKNQQQHKKCVKYNKNQRKSLKKTQHVRKSTKHNVLGREAFFLKSISFYKDKSLGDAPARGGMPQRGGDA